MKSLTELGHGRVAVGFVAAVLDESGQTGLLSSVLELNAKLVLEAIFRVSMACRDQTWHFTYMTMSRSPSA